MKRTTMNPLSFGLIFRFVARFSLLLRSVIIRLLVIIAFRFLSVSVIPVIVVTVVVTVISVIISVTAFVTVVAGRSVAVFVTRLSVARLLPVVVNGSVTGLFVVCGPVVAAFATGSSVRIVSAAIAVIASVVSCRTFFLLFLD